MPRVWPLKKKVTPVMHSQGSVQLRDGAREVSISCKLQEAFSTWISAPVTFSIRSVPRAQDELHIAVRVLLSNNFNRLSGPWCFAPAE